MDILKNTKKVIIQISTPIVVTFEKTEIKNGEEYLIKALEFADLPQLRKDIANDIYNLSHLELDIVNVKWENQ